MRSCFEYNKCQNCNRSASIGLRGLARKYCDECRKIKDREIYNKHRLKILKRKVCVRCKNDIPPAIGVVRREICNQCKDDILSKYNTLKKKRCVYCDSESKSSLFCSRNCLQKVRHLRKRSQVAHN